MLISFRAQILTNLAELKSKGIFSLFLLGGIILFWSLRIYYWLITLELPFSDMAGYDSQARNIVNRFSFESFNWTPFYKSIITPTLPLLRAIQILIFGDSLIAWQFFQATLTFVGLLWLVYEVIKLSRNRWLGVSLLWIVALSQSSIFWSYKISREGTTELFIYWCLASTFFALRSKRLGSLAWLGFVYAFAALNRLNFALIIPAFVIQFGVLKLSSLRKLPFEERGKFLRSSITQISVFCLSGIFVWLPWGIRSYVLYDTPWVLSTQGGWSFLWSIPLNVKSDDGKTITSTIELQGYLSSKLKTDYEASKYVNEIAKQWLFEHWKSYPRLAMNNLWQSISDRRIYLTKVGRIALFPGLTNNVLIDKSVFLFVLGIAGLIYLSIRYKYFYFIIIFTIIPWLSGAVILGEARMLEAMIPAILFGNVAWLAILHRQDFAQKALMFFQTKYPLASKAASIAVVVIPFLLISADISRASHQRGIDTPLTTQQIVIAQENGLSHVGEIRGSDKVHQSFITGERISRIDIMFATFMRKNTKDVVFHLKDRQDSQKDLVLMQVNAAQLKDNDWFSFKFKPVKSALGNEYFIVIESPDSTPGDSVTVRTSDRHIYAGGELLVNGSKIDKDMAFKVYSLGILRNGSFSSWSNDGILPAGWVLGGEGRGTARLEKNNTKTGGYAVRLTKDSGGKIALYQDIEGSHAIRKKDFYLSCWVYASKPRSAYLSIFNGKSWENTESNIEAGKWERLELNAGTIPENLSTDVRVLLYLEEGYAIFDNVQFVVK